MKKVSRLLLYIGIGYFVICSLFFIILFIMANSGEIQHWEFAYDYDSVREIKIVEVSDGTKYSLIKEIDIAFAEQLYTDIKSLEMKSYGIDLISPAGVCILIVFNNGEYDIISKNEPKHYRYENGMIRDYSSWLCCDKDQFDALIDKYLNQ